MTARRSSRSGTQRPAPSWRLLAPSRGIVSCAGEKARFGLLRVENGAEHIRSAGSGTLVTVGSVHGVLTAAHVIEALPKIGQVGIITSVDESPPAQALKIEMSHAVPIVIRGRSIELG